MLSWATQQRYTETRATSPLIDVPFEVLFQIFAYCGSTELHCTIPFVCKHFNDCLKHIIFDSPNHGSKKQLKKWFSITCTRENMLWKDLFQKEVPSAVIIENFRYFDYHKMYVARIGVQKPLYAYNGQLDDVALRALVVFDQLNTLKTHSAMGNQSVNLFLDQTEKILLALQEQKDFLDNINLEVTKKGKQRIKSHQESLLAQFIEETAILVKGSDKTHNRTEWRIISPVNGAMASFILHQKLYPKHRVYMIREDFRLYVCIKHVNEAVREIDLQAFKDERELVYQVKNYSISLNRLWQVIQHLGLDKFTDTSCSARMSFLKMFWKMIHDELSLYTENSFSMLFESYDEIITRYLKSRSNLRMDKFFMEHMKDIKLGRIFEDSN
jgi:hypothetical protein